MNVAMLAQQGKSMGVEEQGELNEKLQNLLKEAEEKVAEADKIRPSMSEVYQVKASIYEAKGDFDSAMRAHEKSIAPDPKPNTIHQQGYAPAAVAADGNDADRDASS